MHEDLSSDPQNALKAGCDDKHLQPKWSSGSVEGSERFSSSSWASWGTHPQTVRDLVSNKMESEGGHSGCPLTSKYGFRHSYT